MGAYVIGGSAYVIGASAYVIGPRGDAGDGPTNDKLSLGLGLGI